MQPQIYEKTRLESFNSYEGRLWQLNQLFPTVNSTCINEANTVKHCLRNSKLSVINNPTTWEAACATEGFYRSCRGKQQLHMVEEMWLEQFNNRLYNKESLQRYSVEASNNRKKNPWF